MPNVSDCPLCRTLLTVVLGETLYWRTALNTNQQLSVQAIIECYGAAGSLSRP